MVGYTAEEPLLMIPGPTPLSPRVREALAAPLRGHTTAANAAALRRIRAGVGRLVGMEHGDVFVLPGSGTLAMEVALINHLRPGDRVVVVNHGYFADRFVEICGVHGVEVDQARAAWGRRAALGEVSALLGAGRPAALLVITHVDTSTGVRAAVPELAALAREHGTMVLLDGVCSTGGVREELDAWGVDLLVTASQKALASPPGLALVVSSPRATERRHSLGTPAAYYLDLARWEAPMTSTAYFATHATGLVRALDTSLDEVAEEGIGERFARHHAVADAARAGFAELGCTLLTDEDALAPTLSVLAPPPGVDEAELRAGLLEAGVLVAAGIGAFAGRGFRVGHMGAAGAPEVAFTLAASREALVRSGEEAGRHHAGARQHQ